MIIEKDVNHLYKVILEILGGNLKILLKRGLFIYGSD